MEVGAETGVITDYLRREKGGRWIAGVLAEKWFGVSQELLKEDVYEINPSRIDFPDSTFDIVLASRPEHIFDDIKFFAEVNRILKPSGRIFILSPHNEPELFLNRLLRKAGFVVERSGSYCKFFTELIELLLNAGYSFMGRKKEKSSSYRPETKEEIGRNKLGYMVYSWIYPFLRIVSLLDSLLPFTKGYVLYMQAKKK
jgi:SAM-dependent methyltransferase